jgi:hypothetical protein
MLFSSLLDHRRLVVPVTVADLNTRGTYHVAGNRLPVSVFSDGFETGDTSAWSATVP